MQNEADRMYERYENEVMSNQHFERACQHIRNKLAQQIHEMRMLLDNRNVSEDSRMAGNECLDELTTLLELSYPVDETPSDQPDNATPVEGLPKNVGLRPNFNRLSSHELAQELAS